MVVLLLIAGPLGAASNVFAGDFNVNVGGINVSPQNNRPQSDQSRRIDKPQTGSISVPDIGGRSSDNSLGNGPLSDAKPLGGSSPVPSTSTGIGGTFPAGSGTLSQPTSNQFCSNNEVTITRYRVVYKRADGRNSPGIDVPYPFDGAVTGTVPAGGTLGLTFELVRHDAKREAPLVQLQNNPTIIAVIAELSFYGQDRVGNDISATGSMLIQFGNFGD